MPMKTVKKHPFIAKMECEAGIRGISDAELAVTMRISESTYLRRKSNPSDLSVGELMRLAKKAKDGDRHYCRRVRLQKGGDMMYKPGDEIIYYGPHKPWYGRHGVVDAIKQQKVLVYLEDVVGRCYVDEADLQPKVIQSSLF